MAVNYAVLKKGGFMRQKQKNNFSLSSVRATFILRHVRALKFRSLKLTI